MQSTCTRFSVFLGVMLLENYEPEYLESKANDVHSKALEYRELYTACFDAIKSRNKGSVDGFVLGGLSAGIKGLGNAIGRTPIGDVTPIDEALVYAGCDTLNAASDSQSTAIHLGPTINLTPPCLIRRLKNARRNGIIVLEAFSFYQVAGSYLPASSLFGGK
uniref:Uncharacterized protein n=1 Tax=Muribaculaceae bacterium Z82 TaxID=2304548 RepID=A0A7C9JEB6_9BACT